jgi:hypothetical protein
VDADHEHSRDVVTVTLPLPPDAASSGVLFFTETSHLLPLGPMTLVLVDPHRAAANAIATSMT